MIDPLNPKSPIIGSIILLQTLIHTVTSHKVLSYIHFRHTMTINDVFLWYCWLNRVSADRNRFQSRHWVSLMDYITKDTRGTSATSYQADDGTSRGLISMRGINRFIRGLKPLSIYLPARCNITRLVNSLSPERCGCNIELAILKLISRISSAFPVTSPSGECHKTSPMISQHCSRLGAIKQ